MITDKITKKELLLDYTMRAVAENGLMSFSMQTVTKMAGTAEGLIYKHYQTKENLLLQCYLYIYKEIRECIEKDATLPELTTKEDAFEYLRNLWEKYFNYLMSNSYKTLYMYEYRVSPYMKAAVINGDIDPKNYFKKTVNTFYTLDDKFQVLGRIDLRSLFIYITDVTIVFAVRIINEGNTFDESLYENIWNLIWSGESYFL